jgi:putative heme transporter
VSTAVAVAHPVRRAGRRVLAAGLLAAPLSLVAFVPRSAGSTWHDVLHALRALSPGWVLVLSVVWLAGLVAHSLVLTSSLPGLTSRRALSLNLAGSAVANSVPMGGAISVGLTGAMARSWGFAPVALGAYLMVSTTWNVLIRLLAGMFGLTWLALTQSGALWRNSVWVLAAACGALVLFGAALARERSTARLGGLVGGLVDRVRRTVTADAGERRVRMAFTFVRVRRQALRLIGRTWPRLSLGMVGYLALLTLLLDLCLRAIGSPQGLALVAAAVGVERLVSAVPITPGGAGVAELGLVACLTLSGVSPVAAVTATFLYRLFTFFLEIPVGLVVAVGWGLARRRRAAGLELRPAHVRY